MAPIIEGSVPWIDSPARPRRRIQSSQIGRIPMAEAPGEHAMDRAAGPALEAAGHEEDVERLRDYVSSFDAFTIASEGRDYLEEHFGRLVQTLSRIPKRRGKLLEIGAAPFCMTLMLRRARQFELSLISYGSRGSVTLASAALGEQATIPCEGANVERDVFPFPDQAFDVVLCAEVVEHLTFDPSHALAEMHRVLKPDGLLVLTTPNVLRFFYKYRNARNLARGRNLYGPYSGYGPYGRHNREFTPQELSALVEGCGFSINELAVLDPDPEPAATGRRLALRVVEWLYRRLLAVAFRVDPGLVERFQGSQIILTARPERERQAFRPSALYSSAHALDRARELFPRIP
jgi:SAM-dependent methyltransferase